LHCRWVNALGNASPNGDVNILVLSAQIKVFVLCISAFSQHLCNYFILFFRKPAPYFYVAAAEFDFACYTENLSLWQ